MVKFGGNVTWLWLLGTLLITTSIADAQPLPNRPRQNYSAFQAPQRPVQTVRWPPQREPDFHFAYPSQPVLQASPVLQALPSPSTDRDEPTVAPPAESVQVQYQQVLPQPRESQGPLFELAQERFEPLNIDESTILVPSEAIPDSAPPLVPTPARRPEPVPAAPQQGPADSQPPVPPETSPQHAVIDTATPEFAQPCFDPCCTPGGVFDPGAFSPDPDYSWVPYDAHFEKSIYEGKWWNPAQRPLIELGRGLYKNGPIPPSLPVLAETNLLKPHLLLFGDYRTAVAYNDNGADMNERTVFAHRANLDFDLQITATERLHAFWGPLDEDGRFTRAEHFDGDNSIRLFEEFDDDFDTLFFEGDLGYIYGGMSDQMAPFDLPFVVGKFPLLFQNGVWFFDVVEGFAFTFPAKNSPTFDWSNTDLTFFVLFEDIDSAAFANDEDAEAFGFNWFLEAYEGYFEIGYAFLHDTSGQGLSYHNATFAYTRRYFHRVSNSIRVIVNSGQNPDSGVDTADGTAVLIENALITSRPLVWVPYFNMFAGFGRPQQVAGNALLTNTGINFEPDGLTGFPLLDATANDTYGGAVGFNLLGPDFSWQLLMELAMVQTFGDDPNRNAIDDQYAFGMRYQIPLTNAWLLRMDSMYGLLENAPDIRGARMELRWKF